MHWSPSIIGDGPAIVIPGQGQLATTQSTRSIAMHGPSKQAHFATRRSKRTSIVAGWRSIESKPSNAPNDRPIRHHLRCTTRFNSTHQHTTCPPTQATSTTRTSIGRSSHHRRACGLRDSIGSLGFGLVSLGASRSAYGSAIVVWVCWVCVVAWCVRALRRPVHLTVGPTIHVTTK